jgi:hypothetical protein
VSTPEIRAEVAKVIKHWGPGLTALKSVYRHLAFDIQPTPEAITQAQDELEWFLERAGGDDYDHANAEKAITQLKRL